MVVIEILNFLKGLASYWVTTRVSFLHDTSSLQIFNSLFLLQGPFFFFLENSLRLSPAKVVFWTVDPIRAAFFEEIINEVVSFAFQRVELRMPRDFNNSQSCWPEYSILSFEHNNHFKFCVYWKSKTLVSITFQNHGVL